MQNSFSKLLIMTVIGFVVMFFVMYLMIDKIDNFHFNLNTVYMAGVMAISMIIIEVLVMGEMYGNWKKFFVIIICGALLYGGFYAIRNQYYISDKEFLKSMIPHHASALLMCEKAKLKDAELKKLCETILKTQQKEIDLMKEKLIKLNN